jgi:hypothetical protein
MPKDSHRDVDPDQDPHTFWPRDPDLRVKIIKLKKFGKKFYTLQFLFLFRIRHCIFFSWQATKVGFLVLGSNQKQCIFA